VVPSLNLAVQHFTSPGDAVLIQQPVYYPFMKAVANNGRVILNNPLVLEKGGYTIDFRDFEEKASRPGTRLFILCSPHNPVGRVWSIQELETLGEICLRHGILVVSDEIHCDLVFSGRRHIPLASISPQLAEITITCHAPSKTFNLPGLHMSYMIISSERLRSGMNKRLAMNGIFGPDIMGPVAQTAAYRHGAEWLDQVMAYLERNQEYAVDFIETNIPGVKVIRPEATYLFWLDFRGLGLEADELRIVLKKDARLALNQGDLYGPEGRGFIRMNIACPRSILEEALDRLKKCFGAVNS
jgi:cystathionine beta-lyase